MIALGLPGAAVLASGQIGVVVATQVASHEPSAVARLYYAERLFSLPLGFVAAAAGTVLLPELSRLMCEGGPDDLHEAHDRALEWALLLALPAAVALVLLALPIVSVLFERGSFGSEDARVTAACLAALAPGLPAAALARVTSQLYFARESIRIPLVTTLGGVTATLAAALALEPRLGAPGVALAVSIGAWCGAILLFVAAIRDGSAKLGARLRRRLPRIAAAAAVMGAGVWAGASLAADGLSVASPLLLRASILAALCLGGVALYAAAALALGAANRDDVVRLR